MMTNTVARPQALGLGDVIRVVHDAHSACNAPFEHDTAASGFGLSDEPEWNLVHNNLLCLSRHFLTEAWLGCGAHALPPRYRLADIFYRALTRLRMQTYAPSLGAIPDGTLSPQDIFQIIHEQDAFVSALTQYNAAPAIIAASTLAVKCGAAQSPHAGFLINVHELNAPFSAPSALADHARGWLSSRKTVCRHGVVFVDTASSFNADIDDTCFNGSVHFLGKAEDTRFVICVTLINDVIPDREQTLAEEDHRFRLGRSALRDVFAATSFTGSRTAGHGSQLKMVSHPAYVDKGQVPAKAFEAGEAVISTAAVARRFFGYKGLT